MCKDGWTDRGAIWVVGSHRLWDNKSPFDSILSESCAKTAKPIHLPFQLWTRVGRRMHKFNRIREVAQMCPYGRTCCRHLSNNIKPSVYDGDAPYGNYLDHLLSLDTPTYTVTQIAKRFEPSTVLWAFHTIQPSSIILSRPQRYSFHLSWCTF